MSFTRAARAAGAGTTPMGDPTHCGQPMAETTDMDRQIVRYACLTCGTDITHIDGHGQPASITPNQRRQAEATGELWTVGSNPDGPLQGLGAGGTAHR